MLVLEHKLLGSDGDCTRIVVPDISTQAAPLPILPGLYPLVCRAVFLHPVHDRQRVTLRCRQAGEQERPNSPADFESTTCVSGCSVDAMYGISCEDIVVIRACGASVPGAGDFLSDGAT